jgi:hypothetical protein
MDRIFARSPYMVEINELGQIETKLQIFIWNGTGPAPASPTQTLSKKIPATNSTATYYDVSPYILEYIKHTSLQTVTGIAAADVNQYCNVQIKRFKKISTSFIQVGTTETYLGFAGYGYFEQLSNPDLGAYHMNADTYQYNPLGNSTGFLTMYAESGQFVRYTNLISGAVTTLTLGTAGMKNIALVRTAFINDGNICEILNSSMIPEWTAVMQANHECKYEPVECNFVNKFGAWQSTFFFKVSKRTINKQDHKYKLNPSTWPYYSSLEPQIQTFNTNGTESITVNTGWVKESYAEIVTQLMLSERILVDGLPYTLNTSATELYESINSKNINYQLQFDAAFDKLNSVN